MKYLERITKKKLGEILISEEVITKDQLEIALEEQNKTGEMLGEILISMSAATEMDIAKAQASQFQLPFLYASRYTVTDKVKKLFPAHFIKSQRILPLDVFGSVLSLAISEIPDMGIIEKIKKETGRDIFLYITTKTDIINAINNLFPQEEEDEREETGEGDGWEDIFDLANEEIVKELEK